MAMDTAKLFFELRLQLWDYAAAGLIAMEAGSLLNDLDGTPLDCNGPSSILCASRGVVKESYRACSRNCGNNKPSEASRNKAAP